MTRTEKIHILKKIAAGEAPPSAINGPRMPLILYSNAPGTYSFIGGGTINQSQLEAMQSEIEGINALFPDFPKMPTIIFTLDDRYKHDTTK